MGMIQNKVTVSQPNSHVVVKNAGGLRGLTGETGPQGPQGVPGEAATVTAGTTTTLPAGSDATVQNVGSTSAAIFNFGIPKGDKGDTGETGAAATISVGSTSTLPAGSSAAVTNSGTSSAAVFDFGIPKGDKGDTGATGADGYSPSATVTKTGDTATITITDKDGTTTASISDGTTPTVNDGTLTIQKNGTTVQTFSADQASNVTANITVPTQFSELSGTVSSSQIEDEAVTTGSVTGTGTNITLAGTMEGGAIESVELNGDTEQTTYSGKNLANPEPLGYADMGITATYNAQTGEITLSGTATGGYSIPFRRVDQAIPAGTYTIKQYGELSHGRMGINFRRTDGTQITEYVVNTGTLENTFTLSEPAAKTYLFTLYHAANQTVEGTVKFQLESGSTPTSFEPYVGGTASPNPDYPQAVQTVTGEQSIEVRGSKNLFNKAAIVSGKIVSRTDGTLADNVSYGATEYIPVVAGQQYRFTAGFNYWYTAVYDKDKKYVSNVDNTQTITIPAGASFIRSSVYIAQLDDAQFEKGSTSTPYEPYQGGSYPINLGKNLFDKDNFPSIDGFIRADNYTLTSSASNKTTYIQASPNTTYTFSGFALGVALVVGTFNKVPALGDVANARVLKGASDTTVTITTGASDSYIAFMYQTSSDTLDTSAFQIEKGSTATAYAPYFTPIELCKIGTYQDYIYKSGSDWYVRKETNKVVFDGSEAWGVASTNPNMYYLANAVSPAVVEYPSGFSDYFTVVTRYPNQHLGELAIRGANKTDLMIRYDSMADVTALTTWFGTHNTSLYYPLATATDTQITNATLISELEDLLSATTYSGTTYITVSGDLASPLEVVAEADSKLAPDSVYGAAIKDGAVATDKIEDGAVTPAKISTSTYQSEETAVGTWIDGKTIYRQVLTGTVQITANNVATVTTTIAAKSIVSTSGWYQSWKQNDTTSNKVAFGHIMGDKVYSYALIRSGNYIELGFISTVNVNSQYEVVVEYTKKD